MQVLIRDKSAVDNRLAYIRDLIERGLKAGPVLLTFGRMQRNTEQNAKLHAMLRDIARQVEWHGKLRSVDDWKVIMMSALHHEQGDQGEIVLGLHGELVPIGYRTSKLSVGQFADLITLVQSFGDDKRVKWTQQEKL